MFTIDIENLLKRYFENVPTAPPKLPEPSETRFLRRWSPPSTPEANTIEDIFGQPRPSPTAEAETGSPGGSWTDLLDWNYRKQLYKNLFSRVLGPPEKVEQFLYGIGPAVRGALEKVPTPKMEISGEGINFGLEPGFKRTFDLVEKYLGKAPSAPVPIGPEIPSGTKVPTSPEIPSETKVPRQWRPTPTPIEGAKSTPAVSALPEMPAPGEIVGTPQYMAPTETPVVPPPTETPVTPTAPEIPDFSKLIKPWKSGVNYEEELMKIFKESMPLPDELPKSKFKEPSTIREFFSDFAKYAGIAMAGKDPWEYKKGESKEAQNLAAKDRAYVLQRSAQLANLRIAGLTEKMKREDTDRANKDAYLRNIQAQYPKVAKEPWFQAAMASVAGIPPEEAEAFLKKHVDPKTGLLESFYRSPIEKAIDQEKAMGDFKVKQVMEATGYPIDKAKYVVFAGKDDPGAYLMMKYQRAMQSKDPVAVKQVTSEIQQWKALNAFDPERDQAIALLTDLKDPKVEKNAKAMFNDEQSYKNFKQYNLGVALGAKGWKPPTPTDMHFNEEVTMMANNAIGNPTREKAFLARYGIDPRQAVATYMKWAKENPTVDVPEPYASIRTLFPEYKGKMGEVMFDPTMTSAINSHLAAKYAPIWTEINRTLPSKTQLTPQEVYEVATLLNKNDKENLLARIRQLYSDRKMKLPGEPTK